MATTYEGTLFDGLNRLVCQQWAALGVPLRADPPPRAVVDLEALIWCTLEAGRYDPRLFGQAVAWLQANRQAVSIRRLRAIGPDADDIRWRILSGIAAKVRRNAPRSAKWESLRARQFDRTGVLLEKVPLFLQHNGAPHTSGVAEDPDLAQRGLAAFRSDEQDDSGSPGLTEPATLLLRARSLFGNNAGADVWTALLGRLDVFQSHLSEITGYRQIGLVLERFVKCGICRQERRQRRKCYSLVHREQWRKVLSLRFFPPWPNWHKVFEGLIRLCRTSVELRRRDASEYILASGLRRAFVGDRDNLIAADLRVTATEPDRLLAEDFLPKFETYLRELLENALFLNDAV